MVNSAMLPTGTCTINSNTTVQFLLLLVHASCRTQLDLTTPRTVFTVALTDVGPSVFETAGAIVTLEYPGAAGEIPPSERYIHSPTPPHKNMWLCVGGFGTRYFPGLPGLPTPEANIVTPHSTDIGWSDTFNKIRAMIYQ
jgi:hypothetical protein